MKILLATGIYPPEIGGPATFVPALAEAAVAAGHEVRVLTYGDARTPQGSAWPVTVVPRSGGAVLRYLRYASACLRLARSADVVFTQGAVSEGFPSAIAAWIARKPLALRIPGDYAWEAAMRTPGTELLDDFLKTRHGGAIGIAERMERWVARRAVRIVVPSRYLASVAERWGASADRVRVVYAGVEPLPSPSASRDVLRATFGIDGVTVVLAVMRAVPWKNGDLLIRALAAAPSDRMLAFAGDGPALGTWKALAESLHVADRVRFLGRVDRGTIADWYQAADVMALPSSYEGFPHVVYEAVSSGLSCLVSNRAGNPETKSLFPEHVDVLPIDDATPWTEAFSRDWPRRPAASPPVFAEKAKEILEILSTCVS